MALSADNIDEILAALDAQFRLRDAGPIRVVVCGGTALAVLGLVDRTTKDVDILAFAQGDGDIRILEKAEPMPTWLVDAARKVARDFSLPSDWFNAGPTGQLDLGLPEGCVERLVPIRYGDALEVLYLHRLDQIHFKLFASVDRGGYHIQDLLTLAPLEEELESAARWVLTQDVSQPFKELLQDLLSRIGHGEIAEDL